jgi:hypothetical protein
VCVSCHLAKSTELSRLRILYRTPDRCTMGAERPAAGVPVHWLHSVCQNPTDTAGREEGPRPKQLERFCASSFKALTIALPSRAVRLSFVAIAPGSQDIGPESACRRCVGGVSSNLDSDVMN